MAHFAELDTNNIVKRVIVVHNNELLENGVESEAKGIAFCESLIGGKWVQTSYNGSIRKQFAGVGYKYDSAGGVFISPQPYPSWSLDASHDWQPPTPKPNDDKKYTWEESSLSWKEIL